ncbi:MAG: M20/M25/M40 family metallo-hydrolase, partial [Gemmatimonadaceae bacterium]|nr:M20/M25/M40 family metallo-hydrolase [Gemmatimonadaceae bacterium]
MTSLLRPRLFVLGLGVALAASLAGVAPPAPAQIPRRSIPTESDVRRLLSALADDSLEGRATGTPGSARAARIIAAEMQRIGLEPAGDSGYFQRVPVAVATQSRTMPNGTVVTRTRPVGYASFAALDTVPVARRRTAVNVVGRLRGSDPVLRDSVVLVDAHYDHLGVGTAVNGDSIYNGADDDASGVVAVLEAARALAAGPAPKRTVLFVATTGEEVGLLGTRWFIAHPAVPLSQLTANLEIEMIGRPDSLAGGPGRAWLTGYERSTMGAMFAAAGLPIVADRRLAQQFFTRSDNIAFAQMGIPAHTLSSYNMHEDYHHPSDDVAHVDFAHMTAVGVARKA